MNLNLLAIAAEGTEPSIFGISAGVSFWTLVIFILLSVVLAKFAFPPILGYAAAREQRIQAALDEARQQREESAKLLDEQKHAMVTARQEAQAVIAEAKQAAERVRDDLLNRAKAEQEELVARARQDIERDRQKAIESLRREAVDLALAAAGKLVGQRMNAAEDRRLVTEYLKSVDGANGAGAA